MVFFLCKICTKKSRVGMRLRLLLSSTSLQKLSINYNYSMSVAIYNLLNLGSPEFATYLHNIGFYLGSKTYKLFTFALKVNYEKIEKDYFILDHSQCELFISSPLINDFIKNLLIGAFNNQRIELYSNYHKTIFFIKQVEVVPEPVINDSMKFILLSPMILSTGKEYKGEIKQYYLRENDDPEIINRVFNQNLINKYEAIHNKKYNSLGLHFEWDKSYIEHAKLNNKKVTRKITITKDLDNPIDVVAIQAPFKLEGDPELIKVGFEAGFGEKNSMGFGMADIKR